ncbi:MAG: TonB-dependent receptor, partial [Prevotella sp.]|nr:TonB-dependent receptor [Prevotella sp.]
MRKILLCIILCLTYDSYVMAQSDSILLDDVEVIASAHKNRVLSTAPLQNISSTDFLKFGVTDISDALHRLAGINIRDYGGTGGMKTVSVRGLGSQHTGVSYDGILLSECQNGEIDLSRYSLNNVGNVSLAIGDNDDIFIPARQAAYPAVLSIETLKMLPTDYSAHMLTELKTGSFGLFNPFVKYTQRYSDSFVASVASEYTHADNNFPFTLKNISLITHEKRVHNKMDSYHGEVDLRWSINKLSNLSTKIYYYDNNRQLPGQVIYYTNISGQSLRDRNAFLQTYFTTRNTSGNLSLKVHAKVNWAASIYKDNVYPDGIKDASYWQREYYGSASLLYTPVNHLAFDYSLDYAYNNLNSSLATDTRPYRNTIMQSFTAKYSISRFTAMARLLHSVYLNDEKDGEGSKNMRRLSPSFSLSYKLLQNHDLFIRASYKSIFRAPTFTESYYYLYGSRDLKPEITKQFNLGATWRQSFSHRMDLEATLDGYINNVKDKIVAVPYNMFVWTHINVGKVLVQGVDASILASYHFDSRQTISLSSNYTYNKCENRTSKTSEYYLNQLAYMPVHSGSASFSYENPLVNLSVHGTGMSMRWANNEHY